MTYKVHLDGYNLIPWRLKFPHVRSRAASTLTA